MKTTWGYIYDSENGNQGTTGYKCPSSMWMWAVLKDPLFWAFEAVLSFFNWRLASVYMEVVCCCCSLWLSDTSLTGNRRLCPVFGRTWCCGVFPGDHGGWPNRRKDQRDCSRPCPDSTEGEIQCPRDASSQRWSHTALGLNAEAPCVKSKASW